MAKFRFYQEKKVETWIRDYYTVEADSVEEAVLLIQNANAPMEEVEYDNSGIVSFESRDMDSSMEWLCNDADSRMPRTYVIHCCDLDDEEVASNY